jgi:hypothetical protein
MRQGFVERITAGTPEAKKLIIIGVEDIVVGYLKNNLFVVVDG